MSGYTLRPSPIGGTPSLLASRFLTSVASDASCMCCKAWKEMNRRIFMGHHLTYIEVASIAKEDTAQRHRAFAPARLTYPAEPD
jgi:hypothetical protein